MDIIAITLSECGVAGNRIIGLLSILPNWAISFSVYSLVALVMLPICRRMLRAAGRGVRMVTIIHSAYLAVLGLILVATLGVATSYSHKQWTGTFLIHFQESRDMANIMRALWMSYHVLLVVAVVMAVVVLAVLIIKNSHLRRGVSLLLLLQHTAISLLFFRTALFALSLTRMVSSRRPDVENHGPAPDRVFTGDIAVIHGLVRRQNIPQQLRDFPVRSGSPFPQTKRRVVSRGPFLLLHVPQRARHRRLAPADGERCYDAHGSSVCAAAQVRAAVSAAGLLISIHPYPCPHPASACFPLRFWMYEAN